MEQDIGIRSGIQLALNVCSLCSPSSSDKTSLAYTPLFHHLALFMGGRGVSVFAPIYYLFFFNNIAAKGSIDLSCFSEAGKQPPNTTSEGQGRALT